MSLPNQINAAVPAGSDLPSTLDNRIRNLAGAIEDIFGVPDQTNITNALFGVLAGGLQSANFQDTSASPTVTGHFQRRGASLNFHDGTTSRGVIFDTATQTLTNKTLTSPIATSPNITNGGQWTGGPLVSPNPTVDLGMVPKQYADTYITYGAGLHNISITSSVGSNILTVAVKDAGGSDPSAASPAKILFRHATLTNGTVVERTVNSALSTTLSSGSTVGFSNNFASRIYAVALDNSGTVALGLYHPFNGVSANAAISGNLVGIDESRLYTTVAEGGAGAADLPQTIYSASALSNVPVRVVGYVDILTGSTAGQWSVAASANVTMRPGIPRTGEIIQDVCSLNGQLAVGSGTIPDDASIPTSSEGDQYMVAVITPTAFVNRLYVNHVGNYHNDTGAYHGTCLFQDSVALARATTYTLIPADGGATIPLDYQMQAGTTSATTLRIRAGASAGVTTFNGRASALRYGGQMASYLRVVEVCT